MSLAHLHTVGSDFMDGDDDEGEEPDPELGYDAARLDDGWYDRISRSLVKPPPRSLAMMATTRPIAGERRPMEEEVVQPTTSRVRRLIDPILVHPFLKTRTVARWIPFLTEENDLRPAPMATLFETMLEPPLNHDFLGEEDAVRKYVDEFKGDLLPYIYR